MENKNTETTTPLCPSGRAELKDSAVFAIVTGTVEQPRLTYLPKPQPVTEELIALSEPVTPTEVFRIASPCARKGCAYFDGSDCRLAKQTIQILPTVVENLPPCSIRSECRWWLQEGKAACMRCPQVITDNYKPAEEITQVTTTALLN